MQPEICGSCEAILWAVIGLVLLSEARQMRLSLQGAVKEMNGMPDS